MPTLKQTLQRYRRPILWSGSLLTLYSLIGFLLLPWFLERQLINTLQQRLQLSTGIESIYFNPYSFYFELRGLQVTASESAELLKLGDFHFNFQASRLLLLKLQFADISISYLDLHFTRDSTQENTLSRLARYWTLSATEAPAPEPETAAPADDNGIIPLVVTSLHMANIQLHIIDAVPSTTFTTTLHLASAQVDDFSTLTGERGANTLALQFENGARLDWQGDFSVNPLDFDGLITMQNFNLAAGSRYFNDTIPFRLNEGLAQLAFRYDIGFTQDALEVLIDDINLELQHLTVTEVDALNPFFSVDSIGIEGGQLRVPQNSVSLPLVNLVNMRVTATRESDGRIDLQRMLAALTEANSATAAVAVEVEPAPTTSLPWSVAVNSLQLTDNALTFTDQSLGSAFTTTANLDAVLTDIDNSPQSRMPLHATINLDSGGDLLLDAELTVLPALDMTAALTINELALGFVQAYLSEYAALDLQSGALDSAMSLTMNVADPLAVSGNIEVSNLAIADAQLNETLLSLTRLAVDNFAYSVAGNSGEISEVTFTDLIARIVVNADSSTNIGRSIKPAAAPTTIAASSATSPDAATADTDSTAAATSTLPSLTLGRVRLENASADFTDLSLPLVFNANIQQLNGDIDGISNTSAQATDITLEGQVGEFGLMQLDSKLDLFNFTANSEINLSFTNIDLPSTTPYVIKFAGREVDEGSVDLKLSYVFNAGELAATNQMVLSDLRLGARVDQPGAMDLPLDLALALLKDSNGIIDLEIPVTGNVNDPEFNFGPAIRSAISTIFANLVAAPFRLLGSLIGGGDDTSLDHIRFLPGRADIAAPEQQVLLQLGEALLQRPQLVLEIPLLQGGEEDILALQTRAVSDRVESRLLASEPATESITARRRAILEALYNDALLTPDIAAIRLLHTSVPADNTATDTPAATATAQLDVLAYNADLRDRLIGAEPIGQAELAALALARADSVKQFIATHTEVDSSRVRFGESVISALDDDGWLELFFGLSAE